jgi:hypothetical protein
MKKYKNKIWILLKYFFIYIYFYLIKAFYKYEKINYLI